MGNAIKILYNGKEFKTFEKAIASEVDKLVTQAMAQNIENALAPLLPEIEKEGGKVTVNLKGPSMFEISTKDLSEKLKQKVLRALKP